MLCLAGVSKDAGLRVARCYQWKALAWSVHKTSKVLLAVTNMRNMLLRAGADADVRANRLRIETRTLLRKLKRV